MKKPDRKHYYLEPISFSLFGLGFILTILGSIGVIPIGYGQILPLILGAIITVIDKYNKPMTIIEYDCNDWELGGEDKYFIKIPNKLHQLGKNPSVECRLIENGIENRLSVVNLKYDSDGTVYIHSEVQKVIKVVLKGL